MIEDFTTYYSQVRPTVLRLKKLYHIKLWEQSDWEQEGMLVLYQLVNQKPELYTNPNQMRIYFKTKFSNHINDVLRKQESQKRQFNKLAYEDISEVSHLIPSRDMLLDDYVVFKDSLNQAKKSLNPKEIDQLAELATGHSFKGRTQLIRKLRTLLITENPMAF